MAGNVKRRIAEFYRRQQFRFQNPRQTIRVAIRGTKETKGLSLCFATLCVVDLFGVFPIIALPAALITCGNLFQFGKTKRFFFWKNIYSSLYKVTMEFLYCFSSSPFKYTPP